MNKEDIICMAKEAGFVLYQFDNGTTPSDTRYERFAVLVASAEREACAKVCEAWQEWGADGALLAKAIRAREQK